MATFFTTGSANKREIEGTFSTQERAEADLFCNPYYLGVVREEECTGEALALLAAAEKDDDEEAEHYQELTDLDKYRGFAGIPDSINHHSA